jgi:hypothetical protein
MFWFSCFDNFPKPFFTFKMFVYAPTETVLKNQDQSRRNFAALISIRPSCHCFKNVFLIFNL